MQITGKQHAIKRKSEAGTPEFHRNLSARLYMIINFELAPTGHD